MWVSGRMISGFEAETSSFSESFEDPSDFFPLPRLLDVWLSRFRNIATFSCFSELLSRESESFELDLLLDDEPFFNESLIEDDDEDELEVLIRSLSSIIIIGFWFPL